MVVGGLLAGAFGPRVGNWLFPTRMNYKLAAAIARAASNRAHSPVLAREADDVLRRLVASDRAPRKRRHPPLVPRPLVAVGRVLVSHVRRELPNPRAIARHVSVLSVRAAGIAVVCIAVVVTVIAGLALAPVFFVGSWIQAPNTATARTELLAFCAFALLLADVLKEQVRSGKLTARKR
jgi:hypothetical protein